MVQLNVAGPGFDEFESATTYGTWRLSHYIRDRSGNPRHSLPLRRVDGFREPKLSGPIQNRAGAFRL